MANVRVTTTRASRQPGESSGIQVNVFGMQALEEGITGEVLNEIMLQAAQPMLEAVIQNWYEHWFNFDTGASQDSIMLLTTEVAERSARIMLQAGGQRLIEDARNTKHVDYAPFLEFHEGGGMIRSAVFDNRDDFVRAVREGVTARIQELLR